MKITPNEHMIAHFTVFVDNMERQIFELKRTIEYIMNDTLYEETKKPRKYKKRKPRSDIGKPRKTKKKAIK